MTDLHEMPDGSFIDLEAVVGITNDWTSPYYRIIFHTEGGGAIASTFARQMDLDADQQRAAIKETMKKYANLVNEARRPPEVRERRRSRVVKVPC